MKQETLLVAAARRGLARFKVAEIARTAQVSESVARIWLAGRNVSKQSHEALARVVGAEPEAPAVRHE